MFKTDVRKLDFQWKNLLKTYSVNLDDDLDCIIVLSIKDEKLGDLLYHKIIDSLIDRVHPKNVYKDFSNALENINAFLASWKHEWEKIKGLHGIIGVYHKKTFLFSTVWRASCYLYNTHRDVIEITDKEDTTHDFSFISSGEVASGESLILSTLRLLDILSKDDIKDGLLWGDIERSWDNIEKILFSEHSWKNIALVSCKKEIQAQDQWSWNYQKVSHYFLRACDNSIVKSTLSHIYILRDKLLDQSLQVKRFLLAIGVLMSAFFLYTIISGFLWVASNTVGSEKMKESLILAQNNIVNASKSMNNEDMFTLNIGAAEEIISKLESEEIFLNDVAKLKDEIGILQKQFNGIEPFISTSENTIYTYEWSKQVVKILSRDNQIFVVHKDSITGPILKWEDAENAIFQDLPSGEYFIDATVFWTDIVLITNTGKVVNFAKNSYFSYSDVLDQVTWELSPIINSFNTSLYMLSDSGNQILRHKRKWSDYDSGVAYLKDQDAIDTGRILSLAIDGGIYILKLDGSIVKLFRSPEYRLESLVLNKLPKNYSFKNLDGENLPSLRARRELSYVYMLLDNRILIFRPNTTNINDVKSLQYLGQIEGKDIIIEDFYVDNDGEIFIAATRWVYRLEFDVNDEDIILK